MLPPCPQCGANALRAEPFDFGIDRETGYRDAGERYTCVACDAVSEADELDMCPAKGLLSLTNSTTAERFTLPTLPDELTESETGVSRSEVIETMATQPNRAPREIVDFPANVPVTVALKYAQGKTISNQYGERVMFSLADGRVMFLDLEVAGQIEKLGVNVRENFTILRKSDGQNGSGVTWEVARVEGEQPNGTLVVPAVTPKPMASATAPGNGAHRQVSRSLTEEAQSLVDVFAAVWEYTREAYRGQVKPEEVRAFVTTAYIQRGKSAAA